MSVPSIPQLRRATGSFDQLVKQKLAGTDELSLL
jgi:hypothetical protein